MVKPYGYDEAEATSFGDNVKLPPGGYICQIKQAEITKSRSNKEMLILYLDIIEGEYTGYFENKHNNLSPEKKEIKNWGCKYYQLTEVDSTKFFKGLITAVLGDKVRRKKGLPLALIQFIKPIGST